MIRLTLRDKIRSWIGIKLFRLIGIKSGPAMIAFQGVWFYIDFHGTIYRLMPTNDYYGSPPLLIEMVQR